MPDEAIRFVTPSQRHDGRETAILAHRHRVYLEARARRPGRWTRHTRNWSPVATVRLNPEQVAIPAVVEMRHRFGEIIYDQYGFLDAFNPSFDFDDVSLAGGEVVPGFGWVDGDYLGIDQGPILAMIENHATEMVWTIMRRNPYIRAGLERAGFTGGWLEEGK
jgi:hypothetical protein